MKQSLRAKLTLRMTLLVLCALLAVGVFTYWRAVRTVEDLSRRVIGQTSTLVDQQIGSLLRTAESQSRLLAGLVLPSAGRTVGPIDSTGFTSLAAEMLEMMRVNPSFGSVSLTLDRTGEYVQVVQLPNGALAVQTSRLVGPGRYVREDLSPFGDELRRNNQDPNWTYDPRQEAFYQAVKETGEQAWTDTTVLHNMAGPNTPGVTCATPILDRRNRFVGVVTVDFTLGDLSRFLQTIRMEGSGYAFLVEFSRNGEPRIIAHPDLNELLIPEGPEQRLARIDEIRDSVARTLIPIIADNRPEMESSSVRFASAATDDVTYLAGYQTVSGEGAPAWVVVTVVRANDFFGSVRQTAVFTLVAGLLTIAASVVASLLLAQRVARPLQELAAETERIRSLDLESRPIPESHIREIDELSSAVEHMKTGLRSFEKLVPAEYARWLLSQGQEARLGGERRRLTTYFGDIIGFTALSERLAPEDLVDILAEYLDVLSNEVIRAGGTVDKFNGDDVMAFWGAPNPQEDHAVRACRAALNSQETLTNLHREWVSHGKPILRASFGISTGDVIVGNVGSRNRMNYTVIGDAVNLASRLQGLNKVYSTEILISRATREEAGAEIVTRLVDYVAVAGREEPIRVYELMGIVSTTPAETVRVANWHEEAMRLYRNRQFEEALQFFDRVLQAWPTDGPARILAARTRAFLTHPPSDDWAGDWHAEHK